MCEQNVVHAEPMRSNSGIKVWCSIGRLRYAARTA